MKLLLIICTVLTLFVANFSFAKEDEHGHGHEEEKSEKGHDDHADHDEHGEAPEKKISEDGFSLTPEAIKRFELKYLKVKSSGAISVPTSALVTSLSEKNLYRVRKGNYKRIDMEILSTHQGTLLIKSKELEVGDEIVTSGTGFLRLAELAASGEAPTGHAH